uniref:Thioredoxin-like fold domain-containing protein n=1 Tax=Craspedostauros australis TaxID=1486917 RepID=A0A7R9WTZ0_9STRA|mmetsp:Transcript_1947/g.5374  ORF Transcript_1947/g.5374 Transcript_1947/m.5374 type:complete len:163 (+) Transcript_1947:119-607(+)
MSSHLTRRNLPVPLYQPSTVNHLASGSPVATIMALPRFINHRCPMCTSIEPDIKAFRESSAADGKPIEFIYVSSDQSEEAALERSKALQMIAVPFSEVDAIKKQYNVWSGREAAKLGTDRRAGVPSIVPLDKTGTELAFVATESQGKKALDTWPLDDSNGIW